MIPPLVAVLLQVQTSAMAPPAGKPVHVWLGSSGPLLRGQPVRVYVETAADGYLVVLHRRSDGRIEVLFPSNPTADLYVRSGTYEIKSAGDHRSEEHTSELQSPCNLVCRLLLEKKKQTL